MKAWGVGTLKNDYKTLKSAKYIENILIIKKQVLIEEQIYHFALENNLDVSFVVGCYDLENKETIYEKRFKKLRNARNQFNKLCQEHVIPFLNNIVIECVGQKKYIHLPKWNSKNRRIFLDLQKTRKYKNKRKQPMLCTAIPKGWKVRCLCTHYKETKKRENDYKLEKIKKIPNSKINWKKVGSAITIIGIIAGIIIPILIWRFG